MKVLITGATGMVGSEALRQALADDSVTQVTALVRRPIYKVEHPKLKVLVHSNFREYSMLADVFKEHDACLWCLGTSQFQVSKGAYYAITYQYTLTAARAMLAANPE